MQVIAPLLRVLVALHKQHILHRDIKPENLFLTRKRAMVLGDFGLAIRCDEELPFTRSGTLDYMAPEASACCSMLMLGTVTIYAAVRTEAHVDALRRPGDCRTLQTPPLDPPPGQYHVPASGMLGTGHTPGLCRLSAWQPRHRPQCFPAHM